jgi:REP element-mobilizing transposase RayT
MARQLRIEYPGAFYHIISRGNQKQAIFLQDQDRRHFLAYLAEANKKFGAVIHTYCLMENHYHLMLETPQGNLSKIMHFINTSYAIYFNKRQARVGHLFQGRFKAILIDADVYAKELSSYIHLNPLRAGIVDDPGRFPWSSCREFIGLREIPPWLNTSFISAYFGREINAAQKGYRNYLSSAAGREDAGQIKKMELSLILGGEEFIDHIKRTFLNGKQEDRELPLLRKLKKTPSLATIRGEVEKVLGCNSKYSRNAAIFISHQNADYPLKQIGDFFGLSESGIVQVCRRMKDVLSWNEPLQRTVAEIESALFPNP